MFFKLLKYELYNITKSTWILLYTLFIGIITIILLKSSDDLDKVVISLTNISLIVVPLISVVFSLTYFYANRQFIEVLLTQPISRKTIYISDYLAVSISIATAYGLGSLIPFIFYGYVYDKFMIYFFVNIILTFVFTAMGYLISVYSDDKVVGIGISLILWFFFLVIFDGIIFYVAVYFSDYPIEKLVGIISLFNPVDLVRIYIFYNLGLSELMGISGLFLSDLLKIYPFLPVTILIIWFSILIFLSLIKFSKKDF